MSRIKSKTFIFKISETPYKDNDQIDKTIETFLNSANIVYVNHTISTITNPVIKFDRPVDSNSNILVNIIYRDLSETSIDLTKASKRVASDVKDNIEFDSKIPEPDVSTYIESKYIPF